MWISDECYIHKDYPDVSIKVYTKLGKNHFRYSLETPLEDSSMYRYILPIIKRFKFIKKLNGWLLTRRLNKAQQKYNNTLGGK